MEASQIAFKPAWWGTELPGLRPRAGTYGEYEYEPFPTPSDVSFDGSFDWLRAEPSRRSSIFEADRNDIRKTFPKLLQFCADRAVSLPKSFVTFFGEPELGWRIRSCTACFLDPATETFASPKDSVAGSVVRFLSDQQGCLFWYLYLPVDMNDHCVLASPDHYASDADDEAALDRDADAVVFAAPSFESFMFRFWIENEYWHAANGFEDSLSRTAEEYLRGYGWLAESVKGEPKKNSVWRKLFGG